MGENSKIEWTTHTFNPWIGCAHVSEGCRNCYAETLAERYGWVKWGPTGTRHITSATNWKRPIAWNLAAIEQGIRPRVFCASLADVFEDRPELEEPRARLFDLIRKTRNIDWLLLTKRPGNIATLAPADFFKFGIENVWLGTTVEDNRVADRAQELARHAATVHFLSVEPMIGPVDEVSLLGIEWVICGGESGHGARPMKPEWVRDLRDRCRVYGIPFFFKQLGSVWAHELGLKGKGDALHEIPEEFRIREFPRVEVPA